MVNSERVEQIKNQLKDLSLIELWNRAEYAVDSYNRNRVTALWELGIDFNNSVFSKFSPMYMACAHGQYLVVKWLLELGFDANSVNVFNRPYIVIAADNGHWDIVWLLLDYGADVNALDCFYGSSVLSYAVMNGSLYTVKRLLDMGADPTLCGEYTQPHWCNDGFRNISGIYFSVLAECIPWDFTSRPDNTSTVNNLKVVLDLIPQTWRNLDGMSALHIMIYNRCNSGVSYLIEKGWPVDQRTHNGNCTLHISLYSCNATSILRDYGADVNMQNANGETAYQFYYNNGATTNHLAKIATELQIDPQSQYPYPFPPTTITDSELSQFRNTQASDGTTMLHHAITKNDVELVQRMLKAGYDPNHRMNRGHTPLQKAYAAGTQITIIESLLEHGAIPELPMAGAYAYYNCSYYTPYVFRLLYQYDADFDQHDDDGDSALWYAENVGQAMLLHEYGCSPDLNANDVSSALFHHVSKRHWDIVMYLIGQGVDPCITDDEGQTLLHYVDAFSYDAAEYLLKAGLDINAQDKYGFTPLMRAAVFSKMECLKWLSRHHADISITDNNGRDAGAWASYACSLQETYDYV